MTGPLFDPDPGASSARRNWLLRYIGVQEKYDYQIARGLRDAADDAAKQISSLGGKNTVGNTVRRYQLGLAKKAVHGVIRTFFKDLIPIISAGQSDAAVAAVEAGFAHDAQVMQRLFPRRQDRVNWEDSYRQGASRGVQSMMKRILDTQQPLSRRVYHTGALANGYVDRTINSGLARGLSVGELADSVKKSIRPDTPGGVGYAAKRLARTEINNAYHAQSIDDVSNKPWVEHVIWNLSKVHEPQGCVCEQYAQARRWAKNRVPKKPHPQCMCYITPELTDWDEFEASLLAGVYDQFIDANL